MFKLSITAIGLTAFCSLLHSQGISIYSPHPYMPEGVIQYHDGTETVRCDSPRPLLQAINAVSEEYGWDVNYEDPPYQGKHDVIDMTNPKWRETHPDAPFTPGPAGGPFQSTYPEQAYVEKSLGQEQRVLEKIVSDYNRSGNPGHFVVRVLPDGAFDVVGDGSRDDNGNEVRVTPFWDTPISIPLAPRTFDATLGAIMAALSAKTGIRAGGPGSLFGPREDAGGIGNAGVKVGSFGTTSARDFFVQLIGQSGPTKLRWTLLYEMFPTKNEYDVGITEVRSAKSGMPPER
jgi:hypothetical protein